MTEKSVKEWREKLDKKLYADCYRRRRSWWSEQRW